MCFEFEWLYWAQMAQEEEQRRKDAAQRLEAQSSRLHEDEMATQSGSMAGSPFAADAQRRDQRKPLHA